MNRGRTDRKRGEHVCAPDVLPFTLEGMDIVANGEAGGGDEETCLSGTLFAPIVQTPVPSRTLSRPLPRLPHTVESLLKSDAAKERDDGGARSCSRGREIGNVPGTKVNREAVSISALII